MKGKHGLVQHTLVFSHSLRATVRHKNKEVSLTNQITSDSTSINSALLHNIIRLNHLNKLIAELKPTSCSDPFRCSGCSNWSLFTDECQLHSEEPETTSDQSYWSGSVSPGLMLQRQPYSHCSSWVWVRCWGFSSDQAVFYAANEGWVYVDPPQVKHLDLWHFKTSCYTCYLSGSNGSVTSREWDYIYHHSRCKQGHLTWTGAQNWDLCMGSERTRIS